MLGAQGGKGAEHNAPRGQHEPGQALQGIPLFKQMCNQHKHGQPAHLVGLETVHLHKQLVQGLARVVLPMLAVATDGVDLVCPGYGGGRAGSEATAGSQPFKPFEGLKHLQARARGRRPGRPTPASRDPQPGRNQPMKTMHGAFFFAAANSARMRRDPTPT